MSDDPRKDLTIHVDWINGTIPQRDLRRPVLVARDALQGFTHHQALSIWSQFYAAAIEWQNQLGLAPRNRSEEECEPWEASDGLADDPVELVRDVRPGNPAYKELLKQYSECQLLAAICLRHASRTPRYGLPLTKQEDVKLAYKAALECFVLRVLGEEQRSEKTAHKAGMKIARMTADYFGPSYKRERARTDALPEARARSRKKRESKKAERRSHALEEAAKKFREDPNRTVKEVAESISREAPERCKLAPGTIQRLISSRDLKQAIIRELSDTYRE